MQQNKHEVLSWCFTIFVIILPIYGIQKISWLHQLTGIPNVIILLIVLFLPVILWLEIVLKIIFIKILNPCNFTQIQINPEQDLSDAEVVSLEYYDHELHKLGFVKLTDFTAPSIAGVARLFIHPQYHCFAEVGFLKDTPVFCSLGAAYEKNWFLCINNLQTSPSSRGVIYAFLRLSSEIYKYFPENPVFLFDTFLTWNQEITAKLQINTLQGNTAENYFILYNRRRAMQRKSLITKSIIWCLIEMWLFLKHPKSEWLGDYVKIK